jgi:gamma-glutamylcysteine synthetase
LKLWDTRNATRNAQDMADFDRQQAAQHAIQNAQRAQQQNAQTMQGQASNVAAAERALRYNDATALKNAHLAREKNYRLMRRNELLSQRALIDADIARIDAADHLAFSKLFRS